MVFFVYIISNIVNRTDEMGKIIQTVNKMGKIGETVKEKGGCRMRK